MPPRDLEFGSHTAKDLRKVENAGAAAPRQKQSTGQAGVPAVKVKQGDQEQQHTLVLQHATPGVW